MCAIIIFSLPIIFHSESKTKDKDLEIFKIQVDDIILPWIADGVPIYWWVSMS